MAWIESHQSLLTHRKTLRLQARLRTDRYKLIGHLHALWWWALDNAEDNGDLGESIPEEIAEAAGWPLKKAEEFVDGLVYAEFIDRNSNGIALHNWHKYAGKLNEKRAKDRLRKSEVAGNSSGSSEEVAGTNQPPPTNPPKPTNPPTEGGGERRNIFGLYEEVFGGGSLNAVAVEELKALEEEHPEGCLEHCFKQAATTNPRPKTLGYIKSVLDRHRREGCDPKPKTAGPTPLKSRRFTG